MSANIARVFFIIIGIILMLFGLDILLSTHSESVRAGAAIGMPIAGSIALVAAAIVRNDKQ